MAEQPSSQQQNAIELNEPNALMILKQYIEVAQQKGAYMLSEAGLLKRAMEVAVGGAQDDEINGLTAKSLLIQGVQKGQRQGAYTLSDAALLDRVVNFVVAQTNNASQLPTQTQTQTQTQALSAPGVEEDGGDLDELSAPVPLKPKEV